MKDTAAFYKTKAWQECRKNFVKMKGGLCELCLKQGLVTVGEIVHHKVPLTPDNIHNPEVTLNFDNLQLLCRKHHAEKHGGAPQRYTVNEYGQVIILD